MAIRKFLNKYWGWTFFLIPLATKRSSFTLPMVQVKGARKRRNPGLFPEVTVAIDHKHQFRY